MDVACVVTCCDAEGFVNDDCTYVAAYSMYCILVLWSSYLVQHIMRGIICYTKCNQQFKTACVFNWSDVYLKFSKKQHANSKCFTFCRLKFYAYYTLNTAYYILTESVPSVKIVRYQKKDHSHCEIKEPYQERHIQHCLFYTSHFGSDSEVSSLVQVSLNGDQWYFNGI